MLNNAEGIKTPLNLEVLKGQLEGFNNRVVDALSELRIYDAIHGLELDHVGMRVADVELIETLKAELAEEGECMQRTGTEAFMQAACVPQHPAPTGNRPPRSWHG